MSIALAKNYTDLLSEVYKNASKTDVLTSSGDMVRQGANAKEILYPQMSVSGLGDYTRASGYTSGDVSLEWKTATFSYDRGTKISVDAMDDEETMGLAFGQAAAELVRTKVAPEGDAYTFATLAGLNGISTTDAAAISSGADLIAALIAAKTTMDEDEVPAEDRILFITPTLHNLILGLDTTKSREVLGYFSQVVEVPQTRFYTAIDMLDGSSEGETAGGYTKAASGAKNINFMIIHKPCVIKFDKHIANDVISPANNPNSDAYILKYRKYGLVDAYVNKRAGIYLHKSNT